MKELSEMTMEELWELFPIILKEYQQDYPSWYELEKSELLADFKEGTIVRINHIGSTAIPGILSKPTIDILMEIASDSDIREITEKLISLQWILMNESKEPFFKQTYNKGYTKYGFAEKVYHLHVRFADDWNELYFRDYLNEHTRIAKEYSSLKSQLKQQYEHNREAYTDGKAEFVRKVSELAKEEYGKRYMV